MQHTNCFILSIVLSFAACEIAQSAKVREATSRLQASRYDFPPVCAVYGNQDYPGDITVFIKPDNTRSFSYSTTLDAQTTVRCKGALSANCTAPPVYTVPAEPTGVFLTTGRADRTASRALLAAPGSAPGSGQAQSGLKPCDALSCPCEQESSEMVLTPAQRQFMDVIKPVCFGASDDPERSLPDDPLKILIIGLGSGTLPMDTLENCRVFVSKGIKIEATEYDPRLIHLATTFFGYRAVPDLSTIEQIDGGLAVQQRAAPANQTNKYDIVMVNAFDGTGGVPESCRNPAFIAGVKSILRTDGRVIQRIRSPQYEEAIAEYTSVFGSKQVATHKTQVSGEWMVIAKGPKADVKSGVARATSLFLVAFLATTAAMIAT